jgi:hypothetical protein
MFVIAFVRRGKGFDVGRVMKIFHRFGGIHVTSLIHYWTRAKDSPNYRNIVEYSYGARH